MPRKKIVTKEQKMTVIEQIEELARDYRLNQAMMMHPKSDSLSGFLGYVNLNVLRDE